LHMSDNYLAAGCSFSLLVFFLVCVVFKVGTLTELRSVRAVMSVEQEEDFHVNSLSMSAILFFSVIAALCASFGLMLVQMDLERRRQAAEQRASKARRLRLIGLQTEVLVKDLPDNCFHLFLSHVWGTGQDQMRIVKQQLREMMPNILVFLDVDNLEDIGGLDNYIAHSSVILVYCSSGYFQSKNCMRELVSSTIRKKPVIALVDSDSSHGGLTPKQVHMQLIEADSSYPKWGFDPEVSPPGQALNDHLFEREPIEWNRIGVFQEVTMRLIAERALDLEGDTYVDRELQSQDLKPLPAPKVGHVCHLYCSPANAGALKLVEDITASFAIELRQINNAPSAGGGFTRRMSFDQMSFDTRLKGPQLAQKALQAGTQAANVQARRLFSKYKMLFATTNLDQVAQCDHMLLYLNAETWTRGEVSSGLADEVRIALDKEVHLLLAHEMPGLGGQEERLCCEFGQFFANPSGSTPTDLLKRGIYSEVAVPLKGGAWREASFMMLHKALSKTEEDDDPVLHMREAFARRVGAFSSSHFKDTGKLFKGRFAHCVSQVTSESNTNTEVRDSASAARKKTRRRRWSTAIGAAQSSASDENVVVDDDVHSASPAPAPCEELDESSQLRRRSSAAENKADALKGVSSWLSSPASARPASEVSEA